MAPSCHYYHFALYSGLILTGLLRELTRDFATLTQANRERLVVKETVGRPTGEMVDQVRGM